MIGLNAKIYYGNAGSTASTEFYPREVGFEPTADDVVSSDRSSGWKSHEAGLKDVTLSIVMKNKAAADGGYTALRNAFIGGTALALKVLDKVSGKGIDADFVVTGMSEPQPIDGVIETTFTVGVNTDTRAPAWV